jgi:large subunit ribosomal protein L29
MKIKDIRDLTDAELQARINEDKDMLQKLYFNHAVSPIENPAKIRTIKRDIAKMKTVLTERSTQNA